MKKDRFMIKDNRGASLIAVLVTLAVVSMLGVIISQLTVTNIQMKEAERQSKAVFYSAEAVMDDLTAGLNNIASDAMQAAYADMLKNFRDLTNGGAKLKDVFGEIYLNKLVEAFCPKTGEGKLVDCQKVIETVEGKEVVKYIAGYYSVNTIRGALTYHTAPDSDAGKYNDKDKKLFLTDDYYLLGSGSYPADTTKYLFHADYVNKLFTLEKVAVTCKDEMENTTTIQTDVVFHCPDVNFNGSNVVKDFMRYSLIADKEIRVNGNATRVSGNVYAGIYMEGDKEKGGIRAYQNSSAAFTGSKIITRGNIVATSTSKLSVGEAGKSQIWCENILTEKVSKLSTDYTNSASMTVAGNIYVSDDLEINGDYDQVKVSGNYFGYNFQENYGNYLSDLSQKTNDNYSSAILINGKKAKLDISEIDRLMIAGRTFIDRDTGLSGSAQSGLAHDIPLGESLGVKSNQMAFYIPNAMVDEDTKMIKVSDSELDYYCGVSNVKKYLTTPNVLAFYYRFTNDSSVAEPIDTVYYLNFSSENMENAYFSEYYKSHRSAMNLSAENYLEANALKLKDGILLDIRGDLLYRDKSNALNQIKTNYIEADWKVGGSYFDQAKSRAIQYHSLQMYLEDHHEGIDPADVRVKKGKGRDILNPDPEDPNTTLFYNLLDKEELTKFFTDRVKSDLYEKEYASVVDGGTPEALPEDGGGAGGAGEEGGAGGGIKKDMKILAIVNNAGAGKDAYTVDSSKYSGGLIIATGDVVVKASKDAPFSGLIISGGIISFEKCSAEAIIRSDEVLISQMISMDIMLREPAFANVFKAYKNTSGSSVKSDRVADYLTFENWTKTFE